MLSWEWITFRALIHVEASQPLLILARYIGGLTPKLWNPQSCRRISSQGDCWAVRQHHTNLEKARHCLPVCVISTYVNVQNMSYSVNSLAGGFYTGLYRGLL